MGRGYFRPERVADLLDRHAAGAEEHSRGSLTLVAFELWHQRLVDAVPAVPAQVAVATGR